MTVLNEAITTVLVNMITVSLTMTAICLLLFALTGFLGEKVAPRSRYLIWLIVMIRLLIPASLPFWQPVWQVTLPMLTETVTEPASEVTETPPDRETLPPETAAPVTDPPGSENTEPHTDAPTSAPESDPITAPDTDPGEDPITDPITDPATDPITEPVTAPVTKPVTPAPGEDNHSEDPIGETTALTTFGRVFTVLGVVWIIGAVGIVLYRLSAYAAFRRECRRWQRPITEGPLYDCYLACCRAMNITHIPPLYHAANVDSPLLCGFFRPSVLLPDGLEETDCSGIFRHELIHYRRHDLWVKLLLLFVRAIHFFNPIIHLAISRCEQEMELSCDAAVLRDEGETGRRAYGRAMLDAVKLQIKKKK